MVHICTTYYVCAYDILYVIVNTEVLCAKKKVSIIQPCLKTKVIMPIPVIVAVNIRIYYSRLCVIPEHLSYYSKQFACVTTVLIL